MKVYFNFHHEHSIVLTADFYRKLITWSTNAKGLLEFRNTGIWFWGEWKEKVPWKQTTPGGPSKQFKAALFQTFNVSHYSFSQLDSSYQKKWLIPNMSFLMPKIIIGYYQNEITCQSSYVIKRFIFITVLTTTGNIYLKWLRQQEHSYFR